VVDKTLILRKLSEIDLYGRQLNEYSNITISEYSKDWKIQRIVERTLQMMIEVCLDIAGHIISDQEYRVPSSYAEMFRILNENNIIDETLSNALDKMAKFRNIVVHQYDKVDHSIVISILRKNLNDFNTYKNVIVSFLQQEESRHKAERD